LGGLQLVIKPTLILFFITPHWLATNQPASVEKRADKVTIPARKARACDLRFAIIL